ncbi:phytochelatin synthase family protein [Nostoc sp. FACHB-110]|uniref:phytochelatin synthase family protein n=1 Tax=Nostoc sp. FACHB-110 TaxID=2692834 RepID=UPI0016875B5B|nr:phytochelatin synthase family protein [Nostoc sp. FACHB-110]MBD2438930.1 phytochelatin synthase [Nostoc sp. FACHB-110]
MDLENISQISKRDLEIIQLHQFQQPIFCCNVTAIAYALTALGYLTTVDEIFYVTQLPIASVLDDGMTLAETYDTCKIYIERKKLPLGIRMEHFDKPSMTFEAFIREVEVAVSNEADVHILNFNTRIAHENPSLEGGHFSLLADYDPETQEVTIADTNPKRYTRFWQCPIQRLYAACVDKDSSSNRSRGMIVLRRLEKANLAANGVTHPSEIALNALHAENS